MSASPALVSRASPATSHTYRNNARKRKKEDEVLFTSQQLRQFLLMRDGSKHKEMNFIGSATGIIYFIRAVHNAMVLRDSSAQLPNHTPESDHAPGEDDEGPAGSTGNDWKYLWSPSEVSRSTPVFTFDNLLDWSRSYFSNWHPAYPFLHAPSILDYFKQVAEYGMADRDPSNTLLKIILRSIMSMSLADARQSGQLATPMPATLIFSSYNDAVESISHVLMQPSSLLAIQALLSVILFLVSMLRFNAASRLEGLAVRMAYQLGLHRCPFQFSPVPSKDASISVRIFWSLYCIDRFINPSLGLPPAISDADIDVCIPGKERHLQHSDESNPRDNRLDLMAFLARHAQIRGSIMSLRDRSLPRTQAEIELSKSLDTDLTHWQNDLEDYLDIHEGQDVPFNQLHRCILTILRCESQMALHRPMLASPKDEPSYRTGLQNCITAARKAINTLYDTLPSQPRQGQFGVSETRQTGLLWPSFTWATWLSSFIVIYAGTESEITDGISARLVSRGTEILRHLSLRGSVWPDACIVATRELQALLSDAQGLGERTFKSAGSRSRTFPNPQPPANFQANSAYHQRDRSAISTGQPAEHSQNSSLLQGSHYWQPASRGHLPLPNQSFTNLPERMDFARSRMSVTQSGGHMDDSAGHMQATHLVHSGSTDYHLDFNLALQGSASLPPMLNDETNDMVYFGWQSREVNSSFGQEEQNYGAVF